MKIYIPLLVALSIISAMITAMNDDEPLKQSNQQVFQDQIKALITKKNAINLAYTGFVVGMSATTLCNAIWEEPTLQSDYLGAYTLSVGNRINAALSVGLALTDILWLLKPYCAFSYDASQENEWAIGMEKAHCSTGHLRAVVASLIAIGGGIRRYPRTLTMLTANALLDFTGFLNAGNHMGIAKEIEDLQSESH